MNREASQSRTPHGCTGGVAPVPGVGATRIYLEEMPSDLIGALPIVAHLWFLHQPYEGSWCCYCPTLQVKKWRHRGGKQPALGHTAREGRGWDSNPGVLSWGLPSLRIVSSCPRSSSDCVIRPGLSQNPQGLAPHTLSCSLPSVTCWPVWGDRGSGTRPRLPGWPSPIFNSFFFFFFFSRTD